MSGLLQREAAVGAGTNWGRSVAGAGRQLVLTEELRPPLILHEHTSRARPPLLPPLPTGLRTGQARPAGLPGDLPRGNQPRGQGDAALRGAHRPAHQALREAGGPADRHCGGRGEWRLRRVHRLLGRAPAWWVRWAQPGPAVARAPPGAHEGACCRQGPTKEQAAAASGPRRSMPPPSAPPAACCSTCPVGRKPRPASLPAPLQVLTIKKPDTPLDLYMVRCRWSRRGSRGFCVVARPYQRRCGWRTGLRCRGKPHPAAPRHAVCTSLSIPGCLLLPVSPATTGGDHAHAAQAGHRHAAHPVRRGAAASALCLLRCAAGLSSRAAAVPCLQHAAPRCGLHVSTLPARLEPRLPDHPQLVPSATRCSGLPDTRSSRSSPAALQRPGARPRVAPPRHAQAPGELPHPQLQHLAGVRKERGARCARCARA